MKTNIAVVSIILAFALAWLPNSRAFGADKSGPAAEIAALEHKWAAAQAAGDAAPVEAMLAPNFVTTDVDGHGYGRDTVLSHMKGGHWDVNEISDVKVTLYGNTAIATGGWTGQGVDGAGNKIDRRERWTDTWIKMANGKWQCVASHQSEVK